MTAIYLQSSSGTNGRGVTLMPKHLRSHIRTTLTKTKPWSVPLAVYHHAHSPGNFHPSLYFDSPSHARRLHQFITRRPTVRDDIESYLRRYQYLYLYDPSLRLSLDILPHFSIESLNSHFRKGVLSSKCVSSIFGLFSLAGEAGAPGVTGSVVSPSFISGSEIMKVKELIMNIGNNN